MWDFNRVTHEVTLRVVCFSYFGLSSHLDGFLLWHLNNLTSIQGIWPIFGWLRWIFAVSIESLQQSIWRCGQGFLHRHHCTWIYYLCCRFSRMLRSVLRKSLHAHYGMFNVAHRYLYLKGTILLPPAEIRFWITIWQYSFR